MKRKRYEYLINLNMPNGGLRYSTLWAAKRQARNIAAASGKPVLITRVRKISLEVDK